MTNSIQNETFVVTGDNGLRGTGRPSRASTPATVGIVLVDGRQLIVPADLLQPRPDGTRYLPLGPAAVDAAAAASADAATDVVTVDGRTVIPIVAEQLDIQKRRVETGRVRVVKTVETEDQVVDVPLDKEEVTVERVTVERFVLEAPPVRHEGDVMIVPVMEEVLVVEKRLMVREELRLTTRRTQTHESRTVTLRRESVHVERVPTTEPAQPSA